MKEAQVRTLEKIAFELQALLRSGPGRGEPGIAARSPAMVASALLERPVASLEHGTRCYGRGLSRTHALDFLRDRVSREGGFELRGYDGEAFEGFFLEVPVRSAPIDVGPDERRETPVEFWAHHRELGLVVRVEEYFDGDIDVDCWAREPGRAVALIEEVDRAVEGFALVHGGAVRLGDKGYKFLALRPPGVEPRYAPEVERAVRLIERVLATGAPGEHLGSLWWGPPGNGKTSLVRRLLRRARGVTRLWIDPSALQPGLVEQTFALLAQILRSLGEGDAALAVFEDVDLISGTRGGGEIRTWLSALDGVEQYRCRLAFVGLTNIGPRELDPAVVRPGRLGDAVVEFGPPDAERRRLILGDHLGARLEAPALERLAARSAGFSGAELELLCRKAIWAGAESLASPAGLDALLRELRPADSGAVLGFRA